jgi:tetratricopeptide (TPR) repeat protein
MERQSSPARSAWVLVVAVAMLGVGWLVLATIQGRIPRTIAVGVMDLLLVALISAPALGLARMGLVYAMDRRIDAGDYDGTIRLADRFQGWWPRWAGSYMQKSSALIYAGRFAEAEALLLEANGKNLKDQAAKTLMRSFLGSVFLEQGRYQEARAAFRGSTIERGDSQSGSPKEGRTLSADLGLAEVIRSGGNLDAALDYAMESIRTGGQLYRRFEPDGYARALAIRAWAAGRLNRWGDAG